MAFKRRIRRRFRRSRAKLRRSPAPGTLSARGAAKQRMDAGSSLLIGGVHDPAEKAADTLADQAMRTPVESPTVHRMCAECEEESQGDGQAQRQAAPTPAPVAAGAAPAPASPSAAAAVHSMGPGRPLPEAERARFEPRFGADLSHVRLHDDAPADRAARGIDARAFTLGNDVAFARGEHQPGTDRGDRLMAHELAHFVTEGGAKPVGRRAVRRATLATSDLASDNTFKKVPDDHKARVNAALKLVEKQSKAKKCKSYFEDKCSGGAADELKQALDNSTVYWLDQKGDMFGLSQTRNKAGDSRVIAYNTTAYNISRWEVAATLLHEMFHTCILGSIADEEKVAETSVETCEFYSPWILKSSVKSASVGDTVKVTGYQFGPKHDAQHRLTLGGTEVTPDSWVLTGSSWVEVVFKVPAGATSGDVVVTNHGIPSNKIHLEVTP